MELTEISSKLRLTTVIVILRYTLKNLFSIVYPSYTNHL